jgi:biopolymer transport protein ExbD
MRVRYQAKKMERLNLIPIMDAVFIFIFFLLMSAQFINIFDISTNLPMIKDTSENPNKDEPLDLNIELMMDKIVVKTGKQQKVKAEFGNTQAEWDQFRALMVDLKKKFPKENVVTIDSQKTVPFQRLVKTIDHTQKNKEGTIKLFEQVVFKK